MDNNTKKKVGFIAAIVTIIIILLSLISCGVGKNTDSKSGYKIPGSDEIYDTIDEAKEALEQSYIVDGVDAILPDEVDTYVYGSELFKEDGSVLTYKEGYDYVDRGGPTDWDIDKGTHDYDEGDLLDWNVGAEFGHYVWSDTEETVHIPASTATGYTVDLSSSADNRTIADSILTALGLPLDTKAIISSPIIGDLSGNGYWARVNAGDLWVDGTPNGDFYDDPDEYLKNSAIHSTDAVIETEYTYSIATQTADFWKGGGDANTIAWNWGTMPGTTYTHIRLTNDPNSLPNEPARDEIVPSGWYKDTGYFDNGTADGTYEKTLANYMDPNIVINSSSTIYKRGIYHNTDNTWSGTNPDGWYTDQFAESTETTHGPMDAYLVHPEAIYDHKSETDGYTDAVSLSTGTPGTWVVVDLDGNSITGAPDNFDTKADALMWIIDNHIDYDVIEQV